MKHVLSVVNLDLPLSREFIDRLTDKLMAISEFLHFIAKERIVVHQKGQQARQLSDDEEQSDESSSDAVEQESSTDARKMLLLAKNLRDAGETLKADALMQEI